MKDQIRHLKSKIAKYVENIRTNHISKIHAYTALTATIYNTLEYPAPPTRIPEQYSQNFCLQSINAGSNQMVYARKSQKRREGPRSSMALQMKCMYKTQEIMKLEKYHTFWQNKGILGKMIRLSEELIRIETRLPGNKLSLDYDKYQILASPSWIKSIWCFISKFNIHLEIETKTLVGAKKDLFIMKEFVSQGFSNNKKTPNAKYLSKISASQYSGRYLFR